MLYVKNVPAWERAIRVIMGIALLGYGAVVWRNNMSLVYLLMASGVVMLLTGFIGFCPMCALAGRRLKR